MGIRDLFGFSIGRKVDPKPVELNTAIENQPSFTAPDSTVIVPS